MSFVGAVCLHHGVPARCRETGTKREGRITIQQIAYKSGLAETSDGWSCATFWYEPVPSAKLPVLPDVAARTADIWKN